MDKLLRIFSWFDWALGTAGVIVGLILMNPWFIGSGVLALLAAWYKPAQRLKAKLESKLTSKKRAKTVDDSGQVMAADAFYDEMLKDTDYAQASNKAAPEEQASLQEPQAVPARTFMSPPWLVTGVYLHPSKHNHLKPQHLDLKGPRAPERLQFY